MECIMRRTGFDMGVAGGRKAAEPIGLPPMLTPAAAAQIAIVSERSVIELCRAGELPAVKVGKCWRLPTGRFLREMGLEDIYAVLPPDDDGASRLAMT